VAAAAGQVDAQARQHLDHQAFVLLQPGGGSQREVEASCQHLAGQIGGIGGRALDVQPRVVPDQPRDGACRLRFGQEGACADCQRTLFEPGEQADLAAQVGFALQHGVAAVEQHAAEGGGRDALGAAVEQRHAEQGLQRRDAARQAGLRHLHRLGRAREVAVPADGQRMADQAQFDGHASSVSPPCTADIGRRAGRMKHFELHRRLSTAAAVCFIEGTEP
jgi:hypothetical protein